MIAPARSSGPYLEPDRWELTRDARGNDKRCSASQTKLERVRLARLRQSEHIAL